MTQTQLFETSYNSDGSTSLKGVVPETLSDKLKSFAIEKKLYIGATVLSVALVGGIIDGKQRSDFNDSLREKIFAETLVIYKNAPKKPMNVYGGIGLYKIVKEMTRNNLKLYRESGDDTPQGAAIATGFMIDNKDKIKDSNFIIPTSYSNFKPAQSIQAGVFDQAHEGRNLSETDIKRINAFVKNYSVQFK